MCHFIEWVDKIKPCIDIIFTFCIVFFTATTWYFNKKSSIISTRPLITLRHRIFIGEDTETLYEDYEIQNMGNGSAIDIKITQMDIDGNIEHAYPEKFNLMSNEKKIEYFKKEYNPKDSIFDKKYLIEYRDLYNKRYITITKQSSNSFASKGVGNGI